MTENEFREAIALGREQRNTEFKRPGPRTDRQLQAKVIRAMLGMANKADGGFVIVGVDDNGEQLNPVGVNASDLATWSYDDLGADIANYADPFLTFDVEHLTVDEHDYVVIRVEEFESTPVICKRQYCNVLKDGACYVRGHHKIETVEVNSHVLMRELIDRATEIETRKRLQQLQRLGLLRIVADVAPTPNDERLFDEQLGSLS